MKKYHDRKKYKVELKFKEKVKVWKKSSLPFFSDKGFDLTANSFKGCGKTLMQYQLAALNSAIEKQN